MAEVGDIIRLTKLRVAYTNHGGAASAQEPAYFQIKSVGKTIEATMLYAPACPAKFMRRSMTWNIANDDYYREAWGDGPYEVVAEEDVPDEVWAAIAKRVLLGDTNNEGR